MKTYSFRTIVVGSGCAGFNGADWLSILGETSFALVTEGILCGTSRNTGSDKQTYYKLSLAGDEQDSVGEMAKSLWQEDSNGDTALCEAAGSAPCFLRLAALGVPFPTNEYGEYVGYQTDHSNTKRATSVGPLTSRYMTEALEKNVHLHGVQILDKLLVSKILTDQEGVYGVMAYDMQMKEWVFIRCAHVMLCTGGPAQIYRDRVYPESQYGSSGMAFEIGASGANLDCWQYGLASVKFRWNVSGSYQQVIPRYVSVDEDGNEYEFLAQELGKAEAMNRVFLKGYQWPYDERKKDGSSRVDILVKAENDKGRRVYMDFTKDPAGWDIGALSEEARNYLVNCSATMETPVKRLQVMNPLAIQLYLSHGIDLTREKLEIRVCAQHHNGGLAVDRNWQTEIPGLYVCGEAAGTFGKFRPGGSALNSTQVGSMRAANHIARESKREIQSGKDVRYPLLPKGDVDALTENFQKSMSKVAAFERDPEAMKELYLNVTEKLQDVAPAASFSENSEDLIRRIRLRDLLLCQKEVLSAMIYAEKNPGRSGVLMTKDGESRRVPARPFPERDLWFERVWNQYRRKENLKKTEADPTDIKKEVLDGRN